MLANVFQPYSPDPEPITRMPDGTIKQLNPMSGTEVWTVPGRGNRPLGIRAADPQPLDHQGHGSWCAFCQNRYLETPPEKSRRIRQDDGQWRTLHHLPASELSNTIAEFRRIPNLFEIVTYDYWVTNYGYIPTTRLQEWRARYLSEAAGKEHLLNIVRTKATASGMNGDSLASLNEHDLLNMGACFFGGGHDVIVGRRHYVDDATDDSQLASSGILTPEEHAEYLQFTVDAMHDLYETNRYARYVAVFQNWLKPAGASFDHLHKQLVAIDERGVQSELELQKIRTNPNLYNERGVNYAAQQNLVIAENDHAIAFAGFGHRYPTLEIYSKSATVEPWLHTPEELRGLSDLVHACHAATGPDVPCNEEWQYRPPDVDVPMPLRINLKWRVSTLAGFEGGTKVYLNTIDPWTLRDRVVPKLFELRHEGRIAWCKIAMECDARPNCLRYNRQLTTWF